MSKLPEAMIELAPDAQWIVRDDVLEWNDTTQTQPTQAEIDAKITELENGEDLELLRIQRNNRLSETDWWAMSDRTMTQAETDYRQALRDITDNYSSLDTVVWPTKP